MKLEWVRCYFLLYLFRQFQQYIDHPGVHLLLTRATTNAIVFYYRQGVFAARVLGCLLGPSDVLMNHPGLVQYYLLTLLQQN